MCSFGRVAFKNGLRYRYSDFKKIFNCNILATFYANMIKIGPVTPEITKVTNAPFWMRQQKSAYLTEYLTNNWTDLHRHFSFGRRMHGDYKAYITFTVVQGTLLWSPFNFGGF